MEICAETVVVNTTGSAGSATGSARFPAVMGFLLDFYLDYHASAPATTDVTLAAERQGNLLVVTDSKTDALIAPRQKLVDNANAAIANSNERFPINGVVTAAVAGCDALTGAVTITMRYLRG